MCTWFWSRKEFNSDPKPGPLMSPGCLQIAYNLLLHFMCDFELSTLSRKRQSSALTHGASLISGENVLDVWGFSARWAGCAVCLKDKSFSYSQAIWLWPSLKDECKWRDNDSARIWKALFFGGSAEWNKIKGDKDLTAAPATFLVMTGNDC